MYYVYVILSKENKRYIGHCHNLEDRILRHNQGRERATKLGKPWKLIYNEALATRAEAMAREKQLKSYKSGEALKKLLNKKNGE